MRYGLLGRSLNHSWSAEIHGMLGNPSYEFFEREPDELEELFSRTDVGGLNVTIPYKTAVLPYLTEVTERAKRIGCVNTVLFRTDGTRIGDNTDYDGFAEILEHKRIDVENRRVLILGTGATSRTVEAVCRDRGASGVRKLSRQDLPPDADALRSDVVINCTPVGMHPNQGESLIHAADFQGLEAVIDVIYNPHRTELLLEARELGLVHADGLPMLVRQAVAASELFLDTVYDAAVQQKVLRTIRLKTENIVLIGMPGCGKSTIGNKLAEAMNKRFTDIDRAIEAKIGMPIADYFEKEGETAFRKLEKKFIQDAGKEGNQVIATGGGAVKDRDNYAPLAQNGCIFYLQRDINRLATRGRPLSAGGRDTLNRLFRERDPLYRAFADIAVPEGGISETVERIQEDFDAYCSH